MLPKSGAIPRLELGPVLLESKLMELPWGATYLGQHVGLGQPVVVRVLHPNVKSQLKDYQKFMHESRRLGQVRHARIAGVLDLGECHGHAFMVLEYVSGVPLSERINVRPLSEAQALELLLPIAEGLAELWRKELVHRGISAHIIHIQHDGSAKLDLTVLRRHYTEARFKTHMAPLHAPYWSPEELRGQAVDLSSDMWSFGAVLYHAVTGQLPFVPDIPGTPGAGYDTARMSDDPRDPLKFNPHLHPPMRELLLKLLSHKYEDRFLGIEAFLAALRAIQFQLSGAHNLKTQRMLAPTPDTGRAPLPGDVLGNCRLIKELGKGAFGVVYLARHQVLDMDVAVKILPVESAYRDPTYVDMFLREARTAARIRHRNVIGLFEAGIQEGQHFIVMELAPGGSVSERMFLQGGTLPHQEVSRILLEAARGLAAAAELNIVHRDIKPDNLMYSSQGEVKIADLGLAKRLLIPGLDGNIRASLAAEQLSLKGEPGILAGTPAYMAPEMAAAPDKVDTRADLYSLGISAFQMLTGQLPFEGASAMETIMKHVLEDPISVRELEPSVPEDLAAIVLRLMQKRPEQRFASAQELVQALEFRNVAEGMMSTF